LVVFSWKLGASHCPKKISSAIQLDDGRYLPLSRRTLAALPSMAVTEKVDWKPCCVVLVLASMGS
jgi:hypothetical protein